MLESLLDWRPANLLKRDSRTGVFQWVLQKKLRTTFWQDTSEWLHLNLSQPKVLKYLLTTLQPSKAFKSYFICCLISNLEAYSEPCQIIRFACYLLTTCANRFIHKTIYLLIIRFKSFILFVFLLSCYKIGKTYIITPWKCLSSFRFKIITYMYYTI